MKIIRAILIMNVAVAVLALRGYTQTISPAIVECSAKKCNGEFTITNNGILPMTVTVEPHSFALGSDGGTILRTLDPTVDLQLDEMAARLGPQAAHTFGYKLRCKQMPCLVNLNVALSGNHTDEGIAVRIILPHVIYGCDKAKDCRAGVRKAAGLAR
jgi:hypothetical protein